MNRPATVWTDEHVCMMFAGSTRTGATGTLEGCRALDADDEPSPRGGGGFCLRRCGPPPPPSSPESLSRSSLSSEAALSASSASNSACISSGTRLVHRASTSCSRLGKAIQIGAAPAPAALDRSDPVGGPAPLRCLVGSTPESQSTSSVSSQPILGRVGLCEVQGLYGDGLVQALGNIAVA